MATLSNVHTHTTHSDGVNSAREMIGAALAKGFVSLGFSDHGWAPHDVCSMSPEGEQAYRQEIRALAEEYRDRLEIALGYEHDASMPDADLSPYDYVIESVHFFSRGGEYRSLDESPERLRQILREWYGGDAYRMCRDYFRSVCDSLLTPGIAIAGHIDLISKFIEIDPLFDPDDDRYLSPALEAAALAAERDLLVEINTGAMSRGCRTQPYPAPALLRRLSEMGGRVIITSDCHSAEALDHGFVRAEALARACSFRERWTLRGGGFVPVSLD